MEILEVVKTAGDLGGLGAVILLILYAVDKGYLKVSPKNGNGHKKEEVPAWAQQLLAYYNHDTTDKLDKIYDLSTKVLSGVDKIHDKHDEWQRYGIPSRCVEQT